MRWTEKYACTAQWKAIGIAVAMFVTFQAAAVNAEELRVKINKGVDFPGCADEGLFKTEFHLTLGPKDWDYPWNQAPNIEVWIRPEYAKYALSLEILITPRFGKPIHYERTTFYPTECSSLVVRAARIAAVMVPPPEPAPPRLRKFVGIQVDSNIWPTPWTPSLTVGANVAIPWNPAWTIGGTLGWALPITWQAPDGEKIDIQFAGATGFHVHRNFERGRIGGHVKGGTMLLERAFTAATKSGPASHFMAGINGGVYFKPWGNEPRAYLGADISLLTLRPSIRVSPVIRKEVWHAPAANVSMSLLIEWQ